MTSSEVSGAGQRLTEIEAALSEMLLSGGRCEDVELEVCGGSRLLTPTVKPRASALTKRYPKLWSRHGSPPTTRTTSAWRVGQLGGQSAKASTTACLGMCPRVGHLTSTAPMK